MKTRGATSFTKAILVLLTSARLSLQDDSYYPDAFSNWNELRSCAQNCLTYNFGNLGCSVNECYCRADILPQAVSLVSKCASSSCSNTNDVVSATSFYEAYCASATNTAVIFLITNTPPAAIPGSAVTGTITSTITTTLANGQPTVVGSIIYQYGSNDNIGGNQNNGNTSPKSSAVRQVADFLRSAGGWSWAFYAWVTMVMVVIVAA